MAAETLAAVKRSVLTFPTFLVDFLNYPVVLMLVFLAQGF